MAHTFTEEEVANLISLVAEMITTTSGSSYENYYRCLCDSDISNDLASHIIAVVQNQRRAIPINFEPILL